MMGPLDLRPLAGASARPGNLECFHASVLVLDQMRGDISSSGNMTKFFRSRNTKSGQPCPFGQDPAGNDAVACKAWQRTPL